jgi:cytochrome c5
MRAIRRPLTASVWSALGLVFGLAAVAPALADDLPAAKRLSGRQVYDQVCIACHYPPGLGGAPGLGDSKAWAERLERAGSLEALREHALNGFSGSSGIMPRKGGRPDLSDEEIVAAVDFMVEQSKPR